MVDCGNIKRMLTKLCEKRFYIDSDRTFDKKIRGSGSAS